MECAELGGALHPHGRLLTPTGAASASPSSAPLPCRRHPSPSPSPPPPLSFSSCRIPRAGLPQRGRPAAPAPQSFSTKGGPSPINHEPNSAVPSSDNTASGNTSSFCIIEGPEALVDFARLQLQEIEDSIRSRRNAIFLLMEEVRRLRIQLRLKALENGEDERDLPEFTSFIPFLPPLTSTTLKQYYATCLLLMAGIVAFGGLLAPMLELRLGLGGTTYEDFIRSLHLPLQLSQVDPIVASFSGGAVGVISSLMVVEMNNVRQQEHKRCKYCHGTGYLACARCAGTGATALEACSSNTSLLDRCQNCSGAGKVMCPTCLCTGMVMASEHNPRIDPFD